ncbi:hypothetical protein K469DRAFT_655201 [Zopfia rhizophila CBS 207.26]|uniref:Membrane insertase YidC/Oxa/ALB C-terminal domain-containing protein n=1 Tax=Zopfia rhizophila CBS 207.26 TaxID=1314779 RepID=A0A6A6EMM2_9PEZI|nr:hypothetical protein K469DRAFT_655201 [Zopfia rhizophila CBS 207.26]
MLPSRGLRPAHFVPLAPHQSLLIRSNASRKFSTAPRTAALSSPSCRTNPLQSTNWRTGSIIAPALLPTASTVRNWSWYAPWSWGRSTPHPADASPAAPPAGVASPVSPPEPETLVTLQTPELVPGTVDTPPVVDTTLSVVPPESVEGLLESPVDITQIPERIGYLKEIGLDYGWGPTSTIQWILEHIHVYTGFSWGVSIVISTLLIRAALFKLQIGMSDNMARMAAMAPVTKGLTDKITKARMNGDSQGVQTYKTQLGSIYKDAGINPLKGMMLPVTQAVLGIGAFRLIRGMAQLPVPAMKDAGFLWFKDLTVSDPYFILPVMVGGMVHLTARFGGESGASQQNMGPSMRLVMMYVLPLVMTTVGLWMPAGVQISFFLSTLLGVLSGQLFKNPKFRAWLGIAPLPTPQSKAFYEKMIADKIPLSEIQKAKQGKYKYDYQAPAQKVTAAGLSTTRKLNLAPGVTLPPHLANRTEKKTADGEESDYKQGPPKDLKGKVDWIRRNFRPVLMWRRLKNSLANLTGQDDVAAGVEAKRKEKAKRKAEEYEWRRAQKGKKEENEKKKIWM